MSAREMSNRDPVSNTHRVRVMMSVLGCSSPDMVGVAADVQARDSTGCGGDGGGRAVDGL